MIDRTLPRWLIDDTVGLSDARIFIVHTQVPRFIGELLPEDEAGIDGITLAAPFGQVVCGIIWIDDPVFDADELLGSMAEAIRRQEAVRGSIA